MIGSVDFNHRHADDVFEIGYTLHPDYWKQGLMTEAVTALVELAFTLLDLHKVEIACFDYNQASCRIAEKLGFTLEAAIRDRRDALKSLRRLTLWTFEVRMGGSAWTWIRNRFLQTRANL